MMSLGSIKNSLENSKFSQLDIPVQNHNGTEWCAFKIPRTVEGQSLREVLSNKKFQCEMEFIKQSNKEDPNVNKSSKTPTYCNTPFPREILCTSTELFRSNSNEKQENSFKYINVDTYSLSVPYTKKITTTSSKSDDKMCLLINKVSQNVLTFEPLYNGDQILSESIFPTDIE